MGSPVITSICAEACLKEACFTEVCARSAGAAAQAANPRRTSLLDGRPKIVWWFILFLNGSYRRAR